MIQHVFFDLDNTLWDHRRNAYLTLKNIFITEEIFQKHSIDFEDFHSEYYTVNENLWSKIRDGLIDKKYLRKHRFYDTLLFFDIEDEAFADILEHRFMSEILHHNELVEGAKEVLDYLYSKKYQLHILSNGFEEVTTRKLVGSNIDHYFETITSADEINIRKPNSELFEHAFSKSVAKKSNTIMIGDDWIADIEGGLAFGLKVIFYDAFKDHYTNEKVDSIESLHEIKRFL